MTSLTKEIKHSYAVPATQIAVDLGSRMSANMVMLGFLSQCLGTVSREDLRATVEKQVNPRFVELNFQALDAGIAYAKEHHMHYDGEQEGA